MKKRIQVIWPLIFGIGLMWAYFGTKEPTWFHIIILIVGVGNLLIAIAIICDPKLAPPGPKKTFQERWYSSPRIDALVAVFDWILYIHYALKGNITTSIYAALFGAAFTWTSYKGFQREKQLKSNI